MSTLTSTVRRSVLLACLLGSASAAVARAAPAQDGPRLLRYLRAGSDGAKARNLFDKSGLVVGELAPGTLLAVYEEKGDWLQVEVPGGFRVWVFGQYVKASTRSGMLEITGSEVRQRPLPSSGDKAYPLSPNLARGERVRLIGRNDASLPLERDWVQVWSPPGVRAWVHAGETEALPAGSDGAALWAASAVAVERERTPSVDAPPTGSGAGAAGAGSDPVPAAAPTGNDAAKAEQRRSGDLLSQADALLAAEREQAEPDFEAVREAYQRVLAQTPEGPTAEIARSRLREVEMYAEAAGIRHELEEERERREAELARRQEAMERAARDKDRYSGRFDARGWLERRTRPGEPLRYVIVWAGSDVAEVVCSTGRYDLPMFTDFEVGVKGFQSREASAGRPQVLDMTRLEVLSGRLTDL